MDPLEKQLKRLWQTADDHQSQRVDEMPLGFARRVVRRWRSESEKINSTVLWQQLSQRALAWACLGLLLSLLVHRGLTRAPYQSAFPEPDPITEIVMVP